MSLMSIILSLFHDDRTPEQIHNDKLNKHRIYPYPPWGTNVWEARRYGEIHKVTLMYMDRSDPGDPQIIGYDYTDKTKRAINPYFTFDDPDIAYDESLRFNRIEDTKDV